MPTKSAEAERPLTLIGITAPAFRYFPPLPPSSVDAGRQGGEDSNSNELTRPTPQATLFEYYLVELPHYLCNIKKELVTHLNPMPIQYCLEFMYAEYYNNVVKIVPRDRYPALNRHLPSILSYDEKLMQLAITLANEGKLRMGDLVQMSEQDILERNGGDLTALESLRLLVGRYGLEFRMRAPGWQSPGGLLCPEW
tara:strand:- start:815 stop:1402 length:588 start_codon:yes stop_codon:yes gene_type:complete